MPKAYAYLVISPNPQNRNHIYTGDGVEIKGEGKLGHEKSNIHYIKVGHQGEIKDRFHGYNTHNPSIWFRHFGFEKPLDFKTKSANLKKYPMNLEDSSMILTEGSTSADYITKRLLKGRVDPAARANEWYVEDGKLDDLKKLCDELDREMYEKGTMKGKDKSKGDMNIFDNEDGCIHYLEGHGKLFGKKKT